MAHWDINELDQYYVDQGYTGEKPAAEAEAEGICLEVVKRPEGQRGFVFLPRRWVVERGFAWASRFRRLVKDYERLPGAPWRVCTSPPSSASSSTERSPHSGRVYNTL